MQVRHFFSVFITQLYVGLSIFVGAFTHSERLSVTVSMYQELVAKQKMIGVIGLGYVGLPIALLFAKKAKVIGFDINAKRIDLMKQHIDPSGELKAEEFEGCDISFTANPDDLKNAHFFIVTVPTPIDSHNKPDLTPVKSASETLAKVLKKGDYVVYESTVYPGCTEDDCIPILEKSGLKFVEDFKVGYSPERINPGDAEHPLAKTSKIVSGCDAESLEEIYKIYQLAIEAHLHKAPNIKVAEAAKIIENTQRDLNIALMNELSHIFQRVGINTYDVIEAAGTKWNFLKFQPGLVGGHCIGVDPYYLTHKASELGYHAQVILAGRAINDSMGPHIGRTVVKKLISLGKKINEARVLVMGATFKENVQDIRNSKVFDMIAELQSYHVNVDIIDPYAEAEEVEHEYGQKVSRDPNGKYDAIVLAVAHKPYVGQSEDFFLNLSTENGLLVDIKGLYRHKISKLHYWSL